MSLLQQHPKLASFLEDHKGQQLVTVEKVQQTFGVQDITADWHNLFQKHNLKIVTEAEHLAQRTREVLSTLTPQTERIRHTRYQPITPSDPSTSTHERTLSGVTRERIRQIEAKALRKLRHPSRSKDLKAFTGFKEEDKTQ